MSTNRRRLRPPIFPCIVALFRTVNRIGFDRWTPTTTTGLTFHPSFCRTVYVGPASLNALEYPSQKWTVYHNCNAVNPCPGSFPHRVAKEHCAKETPSREEGIQAGPHRTGRQNHPLGWLAGGTEEVESAIYGQSLLASGLRQARGISVIERSNQFSTHETCWGAS